MINHIFMHCRECMSILQSAYTWQHKITSGLYNIPLEVGDEIVAAMLLLPLAHSNIRWPIHSTLRCTDATLVTAGLPGRKLAVSSRNRFSVV